MNAEEWKRSLSETVEGFKSAIEKVEIENIEALETEYLGRKGRLTSLLRELKNFSVEERKELGKAGNRAKKEISEKLEEKRTDFEAKCARGDDRKPDFDFSLDGKPFPKGALHPITIVLGKITKSLLRLGFSVAQGPCLESEFYNFEALNIPQYHPSRDMQDTFYINLSNGSGMLLRTHTSPVQIRTMEKSRPPLRIISPGRVFRRDAVDASHSFVFHQIEGLYVDRKVSMADLKWTLETFIKDLFGEELRIRFRPSYFPFVEPGAEVDISCLFCGGKNAKCPVCKGGGWIEMLGAGLVHPNVFKNVGYEDGKWQGFAFGAGIERFAMLLFGIKDMRLFYENDVRVLKQFSGVEP